MDEIEVIWPRTGSLEERTEVLVGPFDAGQVMEISSRCRADFNRDGVVNSQDVSEFLTAFFGGALGADFNADGAVDSRDFFEFVGVFFTGCA